MTSLNYETVKLLELIDTDGSKSTLIELIDHFSNHSLKKIYSLRTDYALGEIERMKKTAHLVRSNCLTLGLDNLQFFLNRLERENLNATETQKILDCIDEEVKITLRLLKGLTVI